MRILIALALLAAPALADESVPSGKGAPVEKVATLERTGCYGTCPIYTITIYSDGKLDYAGRSFVKVKGEKSARLTAAELSAIVKAFKDADYFALADRYTKYEVTDAPSCNTSFAQGGRRKAVEHYGGDGSAPEALSKLESRIDELVHIERFIGTEAERDQLRKQGKLR